MIRPRRHGRRTWRVPGPVAMLAAIGVAFFVLPLAGLLANVPWRALGGQLAQPDVLTNQRPPSAQRTRAATPGLKPPGWVRASITGAPQTRSIAPRTGRGTS